MSDDVNDQKESKSKQIFPFHTYVASFTLDSVFQQINEKSKQPEEKGKMPPMDSTAGMRIMVMIMATCIRTGLKYPSSIPRFLYPDDMAKQRGFIVSPKQDANRAKLEKTLKAHNMTREAYKEQDQSEISILTALLQHSAGLAEHNLAEFMAETDDFPLEALFNIAPFCGQCGLVLAAIDEAEAKNVIAESEAPPWGFDEEGHEKYTESLIETYKKIANIEKL